VKLAGLLALAAIALGCSKAREPITSCEPSGDARPICGFQNRRTWRCCRTRRLVVSEMGRSEGRPGRLVFFDLASESIAKAFPLPGSANEVAQAGWGDPACADPPARRSARTGSTSPSAPTAPSGSGS
jgi:hypothetical protein